MQGEEYERQRRERIEQQRRAEEREAARIEREERAEIKRKNVNTIKKVTKTVLALIIGGYVTMATTYTIDASKGSNQLYGELNRDCPFTIVDSSVNGFVAYYNGTSEECPTDVVISFYQNRLESLGLTDAQKAAAVHGLPGTYGKQVFDGDVSYSERTKAAHDWYELEHAKEIVAEAQGPTLK